MARVEHALRSNRRTVISGAAGIDHYAYGNASHRDQGVEKRQIDYIRVFLGQGAANYAATEGMLAAGRRPRLLTIYDNHSESRDLLLRLHDTRVISRGSRKFREPKYRKDTEYPGKFKLPQSHINIDDSDPTKPPVRDLWTQRTNGYTEPKPSWRQRLMIRRAGAFVVASQKGDTFEATQIRLQVADRYNVPIIAVPGSLEIRTFREPNSLLKETLKYARVLVVNEREAESLLDLPNGYYLRNPEAGMKALRALGPNLEMVVVTLGDKGAHALDSSGTIHAAPAYNNSVTGNDFFEATGAGDRWIPTYQTALKKGHTVGKAMLLAGIHSRAAGEGVGAGANKMTLAQLEAIADQHQEYRSRVIGHIEERSTKARETSTPRRRAFVES